MEAEPETFSQLWGQIHVPVYSHSGYPTFLHGRIAMTSSYLAQLGNYWYGPSSAAKTPPLLLLFNLQIKAL